MTNPNTENTPDYERLLQLEGGNNFRDFGGYATIDQRQVRKGLLFRSGVMTSLTESDQKYLNELGIKTVVDFRSREELKLFPNHWAATNAELNFVLHNYSIKEFYSKMYDGDGNKLEIDRLYLIFPNLLIPQLTLFFKYLIDGESPAVVNCSAGQDRTGIAVALVLTALGVPWDTIIEDYHLSTQYRRPEIEHKGVNLNDHAENNAFAEMMLRYGGKDKKPIPLKTADGTPFLHFAFEAIKTEYGSVHNYLESALGVDTAAITRLQQYYLES